MSHRVGYNCGGWTSETGPDEFGANGNGAAGRVGSTTASWIYACTPSARGCTKSAELYCFQQ